MTSTEILQEQVQILVEKVQGIEDWELDPAVILYAWLRAAGRVMYEDGEGIVIEVPVDFDVCEYVKQMPKICKFVEPCRYRCVESLSHVRVYYGRTLVARVVYRNEPASRRVLRYIVKAVKKHGQVYISLPVKESEPPPYMPYLVEMMPHMFYRYVTVSAWSERGDICINVDGMVRCGEAKTLLKDRILLLKIEEVVNMLTRSGYDLAEELRSRYGI